MSYIYSAALVGEYLAGCCAVTGQSARLNSIRSVGLFWYGGKTTEVCPPFPIWPKFPFAPPSHGTFCSKEQTNERRQ